MRRNDDGNRANDDAQSGAEFFHEKGFHRFGGLSLRSRRTDELLFAVAGLSRASDGINNNQQSIRDDCIKPRPNLLFT